MTHFVKCPLAHFHFRHPIHESPTCRRCRAAFVFVPQIASAKPAYGLAKSPGCGIKRMNKVDLHEPAPSKNAIRRLKSWAICALHVDDRLLVGDDKDDKFDGCFTLDKGRARC